MGDIKTTTGFLVQSSETGDTFKEFNNHLDIDEEFTQPVVINESMANNLATKIEFSNGQVLIIKVANSYNIEETEKEYKISFSKDNNPPKKITGRYGSKSVVGKIEPNSILDYAIKAKRPPIGLFMSRFKDSNNIYEDVANHFNNKEERTMTVEEKIKTAKEIASTAAELAELLAKNGSDNYTEALENDLFNNITALVGR